MALYKNETLKEAHKHSSTHKLEIDMSTVCGCFYCCANFAPDEIVEWLDEKNGDHSAFCPKCAIDSVIGSASGFPVTDKVFLAAMREFWFN